jgi:hypothetical protein
LGCRGKALPGIGALDSRRTWHRFDQDVINHPGQVRLTNQDAHHFNAGPKRCPGGMAVNHVAEQGAVADLHSNNRANRQECRNYRAQARFRNIDHFARSNEVRTREVADGCLQVDCAAFMKSMVHGQSSADRRQYFNRFLPGNGSRCRYPARRSKQALAIGVQFQTQHETVFGTGAGPDLGANLPIAKGDPNRGLQPKGTFRFNASPGSRQIPQNAGAYRGSPIGFSPAQFHRMVRDVSWLKAPVAHTHLSTNHGRKLSVCTPMPPGYPRCGNRRTAAGKFDIDRVCPRKTSAACSRADATRCRSGPACAILSIDSFRSADMLERASPGKPPQSLPQLFATKDDS